jgi:hypothetical protein
MKKVTCAILVALTLLLGSAVPGDSWTRTGRHPGHRAGVSFGARIVIGPRPWWGLPARWGPAYPYYVAPPVIIRQEPPVYIQSDTQPQQPYYWYYCQNPQGYYPYVQQCPGGWMTVVPPSTPPAP